MNLKEPSKSTPYKQTKNESHQSIGEQIQDLPAQQTPKEQRWRKNGRSRSPYARPWISVLVEPVNRREEVPEEERRIWRARSRRSSPKSRVGVVAGTQDILHCWITEI